MAEKVYGSWSFQSESISLQLYYDDVTGHPTRIVAVVRQTCTLKATVSNGNKVYTATRTFQPGYENFAVPTNVGSRINFLTGDAVIEVEHVD